MKFLLWRRIELAVLVYMHEPRELNEIQYMSDIAIYIADSVYVYIEFF